MVKDLSDGQPTSLARQLVHAAVDYQKVQERMRNPRGKSEGHAAPAPTVMAAVSASPAAQASPSSSRPVSPIARPAVDVSQVICHACGNKGHFWRQCPSPRPSWVPPTANKPVFVVDRPAPTSGAAPSSSSTPATRPPGYAPNPSYKAVGFTYSNSKPAAYPHHFDGPAVTTCIVPDQPDLSQLLLLGGDVEPHPWKGFLLMALGFVL